jgi:Mlc titration factor MtfA (ptsG expression regulator)
MGTRHDTFGSSDFPAAWGEILQQRVPLYRFLCESDRRELRAYIRWFLGSKEFEGCGGVVISDEIRVVVAAQACLLLLHRETPCYERLRLIRVYPGTHFAKSSTEIASGESWQHGVVLLAWDSVRAGAANPFDGDNVVLHEFAHQLDQEDGQTDGTPLLGRGMASQEQAGMYAAWARVLSKEYEEFRLAVEEGGKTVMDSYGAGDPAEFFAVATECFFEKPKQLCKKHPELYAALERFYRQDPAGWAIDSSRDANQTLEPTAAAARRHDDSNAEGGGSRGSA